MDRRGSISPDSGEQSRSGLERGNRTLRGGNPLPSREWGLWQSHKRGVSKAILRGDRYSFSAAGWTCPKAIAGGMSLPFARKLKNISLFERVVFGRHSCALALLSIV